jgi:purine-binding chemotaxis protein CheW
MPGHKLPAVGSELICISIGEHLYAIDIMQVREIRGWTASTPLPHAPAHVLGMINLRGSILPVIDLGSLLGIGETPVSASSVVMVAQIGENQVGLLVDAVCDILMVTENMLQEPPNVGERVREFVSGVMTTDQGIVTLLCLDNVMPEGMSAVTAEAA